MALSTLSPPSLPSFTSQSAAGSSLPKLHNPTASAAVPSRAESRSNCTLSITTTNYHAPAINNVQKWRTRVSFFTDFLNKNKSKSADAIKEELLEAIAPLDRGAEASPEDQLTIDQIARKLEAINPTKEPLKSTLLNGKWELIYTTSQSILQIKRPKFLRSRTNYQAINADTLRAQNMESGPFFNQVTADLTPLNTKKVAVKFDYFKLGGVIPVKAPDTARGELEITYLDEELRVSRGDKGNLFVLKMVTADLTPLNTKKVAVKFDYFKLGGVIPVKAPDTARGELEITYLDEELRVSRGDKGNLFILKMIDPSYRIPA